VEWQGKDLEGSGGSLIEVLSRYLLSMKILSEVSSCHGRQSNQARLENNSMPAQNTHIDPKFSSNLTGNTIHFRSVAKNSDH
jgi:hypothetical protein